MTANDFIRLRKKDWERLQTLLDQHKGRSRLTAAEVRELGRLYRAVASDLAQAQRDYAGQRVTQYLNQLVTRAHSFIYQQDTTDFRGALRYLTHTIPRTFRQAAPFTLAAFLWFMIPALIGFQRAYVDPDVAGPLGLSEQRETLANKSVWTNIPIEHRPYVSTFIMSNNIRVAILAFGGGVIFGLFSVYLLAMNGLLIGATMGLAAHYGLGQVLLDFVIAHGVIELSVIFMAGGAGLQIGWALIHPGLFSRRDALGAAARRAVPLVVLAIPLLIVAGAVEGFISPSSALFEVKALVGVGSGALMYVYLLWAGRAE